MTREKKKKFTFGPVPSRRLGRSLGIDLVPFKTCTYDCIYCQLGRTTNKTTDREEYYPVKDIIQAVKEKLRGNFASRLHNPFRFGRTNSP